MRDEEHAPENAKEKTAVAGTCEEKHKKQWLLEKSASDAHTWKKSSWQTIEILKDGS